jgi:RHS repeat-associated protein
MLRARIARFRVVVAVLLVLVVPGSGLPAGSLLGSTSAPLAGPEPAPHQRAMTLEERREQLRSGLQEELPEETRAMLASGDDAAPEAAPLAAPAQEEDEPNPASPLALRSIATMPWGEVGAVRGLTEFVYGVGVPGMPFQATVTVAHTGYEDGPTEAEWRDVSVVWEVDRCWGEEPVVHDLDQVVSAPDIGHAVGPTPSAVAPQVSAVLEIPASTADCPGETVQVNPVLRMVDDGSGEVDTEPTHADVLFLQLVPGLDAAALCAPECGGTGGLTSPATTRGAGVTTATGSYGTVSPEALASAPGSDFSVERSYSSAEDQAGALGPGWHLPWETGLEIEDDGDVVLREESGGRLTFTEGDEGEFTAPLGAYSRLRRTDDGYVVTTPDLRTLTYDEQGRLTGERERSGEGLSYSYSGGLPTTITDSVGRAHQLTYEDDRLVRVTLDDGRSLSYGYDDAGRLTSATGLDGATTRYGYDDQDRVETVTGPGGRRELRNEYDDQGRVVRQADAAGAATEFLYEGEGRLDFVHTIAPDEGIWTDIYAGNVLLASIDPFGNTTDFGYDENRNRTSVRDPLGRATSYDYDSRGRVTGESTDATRTEWSYDEAGNVVESEDGEYRTTSLEYDERGLLTSATDGLGEETTYTHTPSGLLESVTTPQGHTTTYEYNAQGDQTAMVTPTEARTEQTFDAAGRLLTSTDPLSNTTAYTYDDADRLTSLTLPEGGVERYAYDVHGNLTTVTDVAGRETSYAYDEADRLTRVTEPGDRITRYRYDIAGNLTSVTTPDGARTTYVFDEGGRMLSMTTPRGNAEDADPDDHTWVYGYDIAGQQTTVTDPLGHTSAREYDADGRVVAVTDPMGHTSETGYDRSGLVDRIAEADGPSTSYDYDDAGRLEQLTEGSDTTEFAYSPDGNLTRRTSPTGAVTTYGYDAEGRVTTEVDPRGAVDGASPEDFTWTADYDAAGQLTGLSDPLGNRQTAAYDGDGRLTAFADARGEETSYAYDALGRLTTVTAPDGGETAYTYDTAGNLATRTDANDHTTTYGYDPAGRLTSVNDPLDRVRELAYDLEGNLAAETNARGQTTTHTLDALGRPTEIAYSDDTPSIALAYDPAGRITEVTDATGTRTFEDYDAAGRPETITLPDDAGEFTYDYDGMGRVTERTSPGGLEAEYEYDEDGRLISQALANTNTTEYGYDPAGNLTSVTLPDSNGHTETRTYDRAGQLSRISLARDDEQLTTQTLTRDANGQPTAIEGNGSRQLFTYDANGRLTEECTASENCTSYTYDQVGNRLTRETPDDTTEYTYDAADQLVSAGPTDYTYDAAGNQTAAGQDNYTYDAAGRLTGITTADDDEYSYDYDADGNRTAATVNGERQRTTWWDVVGPLPQVATEYDGDGALVADYAYNPDGQVQARQTGQDSLQFYHHDWHGSVAGVTGSGGDPQASYAYTAFGVTDETITGPASFANPFTYTSQYTEPTTDAAGQHLRARDYDPDLGRFITQDPAARSGSQPYTSAYAYAENLPTTLTDPSGRCPTCISAGIGAVLGGAIEGGMYAFTSGDDFTWGGLAEATGRGAVIGAVGGLLMPGAGNAVARLTGQSGAARLATSTAVNAATGAGYSWAINTLNCRPTSPTDLLLGALGGGASSLIGPAINRIRGAWAPRANVSAHSSGPTSSTASQGPLHGSGPSPGVLEVSDRVQSVRATQNFNPSQPRDFVYDPATGRFATGSDQGVRGHDGLREAIGASEDTVVGGRVTRGPNGEFLTDEWSGHYGINWNDDIRAEFERFMRDYGFDITHRPWGS